MRILIIHSSPWNDITEGNNVLTNWFKGMDAEFANIYRGSGKPLNPCCTRYFQVTTDVMLRSLYTRKRAGKAFEIDSLQTQTNNTSSKYENINLPFLSYNFLHFLCSTMWQFGKINIDELRSFIDDFSPDVVFTCRKASRATLRLERIVHTLTDAKFIAFTADDEYSLKQLRFDPFFWLERLLVRRSLRKNVKFYSMYLTMSDEQAAEYAETFGCKTGVLKKIASDIPNAAVSSPDIFASEPISIVYAGKLYCNRWKTLSCVADAVRHINNDYDRVVYTLDIYAVGKIKKRIRTKIEGKTGDNTVRILKPVPAEQLNKILQKKNIALHVESFDLRNRLDTRYSFSTKIVDYLSSGCALMAICWKKHAGFTYLQRNDAAICISDVSCIEKELRRIAEDKTLVTEYAEKAKHCLQKYHNRLKVQQEILEIFADA